MAGTYSAKTRFALKPGHDEFDVPNTSTFDELFRLAGL